MSVAMRGDNDILGIPIIVIYFFVFAMQKSFIFAHSFFASALHKECDRIVLLSDSGIITNFAKEPHLDHKVFQHMPTINLRPFQFDEIDDLCISSRLRIETDSRITKIREVAQRLISFSEIPFATTEDAYTELSHQAVKLLAREDFNSKDKNDVALIIALLATEYRHLPTVDKGLSYEDVFKKCYSSYLDCADGPASEEQIEQLKSEVDRIVFERSMYNSYLFMEEFLNAAFTVMRGVQKNREDCARELASYLDTKRDRETPRGDIWCSMVSKILLKSKSLKDTIEKDFHLDSQEDLHIHDTCHNFKHIDYTDDFFLELYSAFKRNENEYHIKEALVGTDVYNTNMNPEILVYDRRINIIKTASLNNYETSCVPIYCLGTVNNYVCSFLNVDMSRFSGNIGKLYQYADLYEADEQQISALACDRIDCAVQSVFGINKEDGVFQKAHVFFVSQWLEYKVNLNLCSRQQLISGIKDLCKLEEKEWENLPRFRQEEFENSLDEYFFDNVIKYGYDFFHYLEFAIPLLNHYETRHRFPRKAYAKALVEYFLDQAQITEITENAKMQIIDILSEIHSIDYYIDRISQVV